MNAKITSKRCAVPETQIPTSPVLGGVVGWGVAGCVGVVKGGFCSKGGVPSFW